MKREAFFYDSAPVRDFFLKTDERSPSAATSSLAWLAPEVASEGCGPHAARSASLKLFFKKNPADRRTRKAFTLLELTFVIFTMSIIALLGYNAFFSSRLNIAIDLAKNDFASALHELRTQTQRNPVCAFVQLKKGNAPASAITQLDATLQQCQSPTPQSYYPMINAANIVVGEILADNNAKDTINIKFTPPRGEFIFEPNGKTAKITLSILNKPSFSRSVEVEAGSGRIE